MTELHESWARTRTYLAAARAAVGAGSDLQSFEGYLDHNELQLAADVLLELGDDLGNLSRSFWDSLRCAYESMQLNEDAKLCRLRVYEAEHGYVEARLTLLTTAAGGRRSAIASDYRPSWSIGNRTESGEPELNDAPVTLEDHRALNPGETGVVRLHPLWPEAWRQLTEGREINMQEGPRVVGHATVLRVALKGQ